MPRFWNLASSDSQEKLAEWEEGKVKSEIVKCAVNPLHQRGGKRLTDLSVVLPDGEVEDFVWTWYSDCLLRDETLQLFRRYGFTGFAVKPVSARFKRSSARPPTLWELVRTGWAGMAHPASGIHLNEPESCLSCGRLVYTGLVHPDRLIDETKWDGSDFFIVWPLSRFVFVTERVVKAIREHGLTGVVIKPVSELEPTDGYSPGRLSRSMPEGRARELGEPLGIF
jgi:hypothetical protein